MVSSLETYASVLDGVAVRWTGRAEGDLAAPAERPATQARLAALAGRPVAWLHQVHGDHVVIVPERGSGLVPGEDGDALVTSGETALVITTADCAPIALGSPEGVIGAVHAGWRGLAAGVVEAAVSAMRGMGATRVEAALGPCIHAECNEFSPSDIDALCAQFGPIVRSTTLTGRPAFDQPAAVGAAVEQAGATLVHDAQACTACASEDHFSHRARGERQRQAMVVWKE